MSESTHRSAIIIKKFILEVNAAHVSSVTRALCTLEKQPNHLVFNCNLSAYPTQKELKECFAQRNQYYKSVAPTQLRRHTRRAGFLTHPINSIPVTPAYAKEVHLHTFNTVTIKRPSDKATLVVLIRCADNYVCAVKVYSNAAEALTAKWMAFAGVKLPSTFDGYVSTKYSFGHDTGNGIRFGKSSFSDLIDFLLIFKDDPRQQTTDVGIELLTVLFLVFGEGQRFKSVRRGLLLLLYSVHKNTLPVRVSNIYQKWLNTCKVIYEMYLYLLDRDLPPLSQYKTLSDVQDLWNGCELEHKDLSCLKFRDAEGNFSLNALLGDELLLLRHDVILCTAIILRDLGYRGPIFEDHLKFPADGVSGVKRR